MTPSCLCIQCSLRAQLAGAPTPVFPESPEAHQRRCHPDLAAAAVERRELERQLREKLAAERTAGA